MVGEVGRKQEWLLRISIEQQPEGLLSQLSLDAVKTLILRDAMQPQKPRELQILNIKHTTTVNLPRLKTRDRKDIANSPLAVIDMVPVASIPLAGTDLSTAVNQGRPRLKVHAGLRVNSAVVPEARGKQPHREPAEADEQGEEVRVGDVAVAREVVAEVWPVDYGDERVDQVEVVGHQDVDQRPRA